MLNLSFDIWVAPLDWRGACIVPLYIGKGDKCDCSNSRGISLLSVVDFLYGCSARALSTKSTVKIAVIG